MIALLAALLAIVPVTTNTVSYSCNGSTATFTINFPYVVNTDLVVTDTTSTGTVTTLVPVTDYSVSLAALQSGTATLIVNSPSTKCPSSSTLKITNAPSMTQPYSFRAQTQYNTALHEQAYDRIVMLIQELAQGISVSGDISNASVQITGTTVARQLAAALANLPIPVAAFGAKCDGSTDDIVAIQACVTAKADCALPAATCKIGTTLAVPTGHHLLGRGLASSILAYTGSACAVSFEGTQGAGLRDLEITTPGTAGTERGICLTNASGNSLRNDFINLNIVGMTNPPTSGSYGIYIHSTTGNSLYYSEFAHIFTLDYDRGVELLGDVSSGGANAHWFHGYSANADGTGIYFDGSASDNYVQGHCNASGQTFTQKCFIVGDGTHTSSGNEIHMVTDQSIAGNHNGGFTVNAGAVNNFIWEVNESSAADVMSGDSSNFMFNTLAFSTAAKQVWLPPELLSGGTVATGDLFVGASQSNTATLLKTNTDYVVGAHDRNICSGGLTGAHTFTLLSAIGRDVNFCDNDGTISSSNTITIAPPATGKVNGSTSGLVLNAANKGAFCHSSTSSGLIWSCWVTP